MKNLLRFAMIITIVAFTMSSCLKDDDNNNNTARTLTPLEKATSLLEAQGPYEGWLYYLDKTAQKDSVTVNWTITASDSTLTVANFPIQAFSNSVNTDTITANILKKAPTKELKFTLHAYYNTEFDQKYYTYSMLPTLSEETMTLDNGEGKSDVISFKYASYLTSYTVYGQPYYTYPICEYYHDKSQGYILIYELTVNNKPFSVNKVYYFYGTKD